MSSIESPKSSREKISEISIAQVNSAKLVGESIDELRGPNQYTDKIAEAKQAIELEKQRGADAQKTIDGIGKLGIKSFLTKEGRDKRYQLLVAKLDVQGADGSVGVKEREIREELLPAERKIHVDNELSPFMDTLLEKRGELKNEAAKFATDNLTELRDMAADEARADGVDLDLLEQTEKPHQ